MKSNKEALFQLDGPFPGFRYSIPIALQHLMVMIVGCVTPAIIISNLAGLSASDSTLMIQTSLVAAGLSTLLQLFIGSRLPMIMGISFSYLASMQAIVSGYGLAEIFGAQLVGGAVAFVIGLFVKRIRKLFPPLITGTVVFTIGLSLYPTAITYMAGGEGSPDFGSWQNWLAAIVTLVSVVVLSNYSKGYVKLSAILIGIGIGGTTCWVGLFRITGEELAIIKEPIDLSRGPDAILNMISRHISSLMAQNNVRMEELRGIGMGIPSPVKYQEGYANHPAFMPGWHLLDLKKFFAEKYNCPAFIDNEVNTMALAEFIQRPDRNHHILLCLKAGTGIGAGLVIDGEIYRGENGGGNNVGHIQISGSTALCKCGKIGCIEATASAPAVRQKATEYAKANPGTELWKIFSEEGSISLSAIKKAADNGDKGALGIIKDAGEALGELAGTLTMILDPAEIVVSGQMMQLGPNYLYYIRAKAERISAPWAGYEQNIRFSSMPSSSGAVGAARLCINELFDHNLIL